MLFIINVLVIWGVYASTRDGNIINLESAPLPKWAAKPLYNCPFCMSSVWGSVGFFALSPETYGLGVWFLPVWVLAICGCNYLILMHIPNE